jgi:hypothetical protein
VLNKTSAYSGLVVVTAAGALLTSSPAYALDSLARGSWSSHHHRSHHRNHNWNGHVHHGRIFIRIYIYNKNNNHAVAVARPERREARRTAFVRDDEPFFGSPDGLTTRRAPRTERVAPAQVPGQSDTATVPQG